jgi:hypothetical protein
MANAEWISGQLGAAVAADSKVAIADMPATMFLASGAGGQVRGFASSWCWWRRCRDGRPVAWRCWGRHCRDRWLVAWWWRCRGRWPSGSWPGGGGPPAGAGAHVTAVPADVGAAAAAVGDQLGGGQCDAAQPAAFDQVVPLVGQIWLPGACHAFSPPGRLPRARANRRYEPAPQAAGSTTAGIESGMPPACRSALYPQPSATPLPPMTFPGLVSELLSA